MLTPQEGKAARSELKLSQSHVAAATGINRTYVSLFEAGKYVLDGDALSKLRSFYVEQGYEFDAASRGPAVQDVPIAANAPSKSIAATGNKLAVAPPPPDLADAQLQPAITALRNLQTSSDGTGTDSKRTVAALTAAHAVLSQLDYPELLSVARLTETALDGLPTEQDFRAQPLRTKEAWETGASCVLLCAALFGVTWNQNDPRIWERAAKALVDERLLDESNRPQRPFFGGRKTDEDFVRRARSLLAPAMVRAAEKRRAPLLIQEATNKTGWGLASLFNLITSLF